MTEGFQRAFLIGTGLALAAAIIAFMATNTRVVGGRPSTPKHSSAVASEAQASAARRYPRFSTGSTELQPQPHLTLPSIPAPGQTTNG